MIEHVLRRVEMCGLLDAVYVATCDAEIRRTVERLGGAVLMTSPDHERASDRVAEAAEQVEAADVVVMVQGDEPMVVPEMIQAAVAPMRRDPTVACVNLTRRLTRPEDYLDPNTIKVVADLRGDALYFSRSPVPAVAAGGFARGGGWAPARKQVCVIPFRRDFLRTFAALPPTPLERAESVDMLRALEHGHRVRLVETDVDTHAVDTPDDLRMVEARMRGDALVARYDELAAERAVRA